MRFRGRGRYTWVYAHVLRVFVANHFYKDVFINFFSPTDTPTYMPGLYTNLCSKTVRLYSKKTNFVVWNVLCGYSKVLCLLIFIQLSSVAIWFGNYRIITECKLQGFCREFAPQLIEPCKINVLCIKRRAIEEPCEINIF